MECMIVRELLPRYLSGLTCSETNRDIRDHLDHCADCRRLYEDMRRVLPGEDNACEDMGRVLPGEDDACEDMRRVLPGEEDTYEGMRQVHPGEGDPGTKAGDADVNSVEKIRMPADPSLRMKRHVRRKSMLITLSVCAAAIVFLLLAVRLEIPLPYDANRMQLEEVKSAIVPLSALDQDITESGYAIYPLDDLPFKLKKAVIEGSVKPVSLICFSYSGLNEAGFMCVSRTVMRDGKPVRIAYFCYDRTLWNTIRYGDFSGISESGSGYGEMYDDSISDDGIYTPENTEIYYLKTSKLYQLRRLSDDDYVKKTAQASLIWSGKI